MRNEKEYNIMVNDKKGTNAPPGPESGGDQLYSYIYRPVHEKVDAYAYTHAYKNAASTTRERACR